MTATNKTTAITLHGTFTVKNSDGSMSAPAAVKHLVCYRIGGQGASYYSEVLGAAADAQVYADQHFKAGEVFAIVPVQPLA